MRIALAQFLRKDELLRLKVWKEELKFMRERAKIKVRQTGRQWTRDELYEERINRFARK